VKQAQKQPHRSLQILFDETGPADGLELEACQLVHRFNGEPQGGSQSERHYMAECRWKYFHSRGASELLDTHVPDVAPHASPLLY